MEMMCVHKGDSKRYVQFTSIFANTLETNVGKPILEKMDSEEKIILTVAGTATVISYAQFLYIDKRKKRHKIR